MKWTKEQNKERYKLHRQVKRIGFVCIARYREVWVNHAECDSLPPPNSKIER